MNNLISIDYYRDVDEGGAGLWSQVFVKVPFDKEEMNSLGAIFGVIRTRGVNLISDIENFVGQTVNKGNVTGLVDLLKKNDAEGVFSWIHLTDDGERSVKVGGIGDVKALIFRNKKKIVLRGSGSSGVVAGRLVAGDRLVIGTAERADVASSEGQEIDATGVGACLIMDVKEMEIMDVIPTKVEESLNNQTRKGSLDYARDDNIETGSKFVESEIEAERLVSDRVVGASGIKGKIASAKIGFVDLTERWKRGVPLAGANRQQRHRWILALGSVFLVALAISVGLGLIKTRRNKLEAEFKSVYEPWEQKRKEAEALFALNPVGARELLRSVRDEIAPSKVKFAGGPFEGKINEFEKNLEASWAKVSGEVKVQPELFYNLGLIRTNLLGGRLAFNDKKLIVLDEKLGIVAEVDYKDQKSGVVLGKGEGLSWMDLAGFKNSLVVLTKTGLVASLSDKRVEHAFDGSVLEPVAVDVFGEAAYVLDRGASEIWRFGLSGGGISERRRWLSAGVEVNLKSGLDLALDGDIFVLLADGKVVRLRRGQIEKYTLADVPTDFKPERISASAEAEVLAFLDSKKSRVVLFNKETGGYMRQLLAPEFTQATDLVLVNGNTLMVLVEGKLLKVGL